MEISKPFPQFLSDIAVFSTTEVEKLTSSLTTNDENKAISNLADFFGSLTPADCYDLALRLHNYWKKSLQTREEKQEDSQKLTISTSPKIKHKGFKSLVSPSSQPQTASSTKAASFYGSEPGSSNNKPTKKYNSFIENNIFSSLHKESQKRNYMQMESEKMRSINETKECTFQPQLVTNRPASSSVDVFDRLQYDSRKDRESIHEMIKKEAESKECTFTPQINPKRLLSEESQDNSKIGPYHTFDRLYKQYQVKRHMFIDNELKRQSMELKDCTFQPALSTRNGSIDADTTERYNKLYSLHSERQRGLMKKRMEKLEEEDQICSFKPQVLPNSAKKASNKDVHERLREWNEIKTIKMEMRLQEKANQEQPRQLNLPAKKKNEAIIPQEASARYNKLYRDSQEKKARKEKLEKRIMKDTGISFTPKINGTRNLSLKKDGVLGLDIPQFASISSYEDRFLSSRKSLPTYTSSARKVQQQLQSGDAEYKSQLKKQFLNDMQKNLSGGGFGKKK